MKGGKHEPEIQPEATLKDKQASTVLQKKCIQIIDQSNLSISLVRNNSADWNAHFGWLNFLWSDQIKESVYAAPFQWPSSSVGEGVISFSPLHPDIKWWWKQWMIFLGWISSANLWPLPLFWPPFIVLVHPSNISGLISSSTGIGCSKNPCKKRLSGSRKSSSVFQREGNLLQAPIIISIIIIIIRWALDVVSISMHSVDKRDLWGVGGVLKTDGTEEMIGWRCMWMRLSIS